ncbi:MAG: response regulator [Isosphaeraceae bacterium]
MAAFIYANCRCGRTLRARDDQAGTRIRCWSCGSDVLVRFPRVGGRLARALAEAVPQSLRSSSVLWAVCGALLISGALLVPVAGPWLALALGVVAAWRYGASIEECGERAWGPPPPLRVRDTTAAPPPAVEPEPSTAEPPTAASPRWLVGIRNLALGALGVAALIAPLAVRNGGRLLPEAGNSLPYPGDRAWMLVALASWVVVPLLMLAAFAHDRRGRLPAGAALAGLARFPAATVAALLVAPLGLVVMEALLGFLAWQEGSLPLLASDLFPPPRIENVEGKAHLIYRYDDQQINRLYGDLANDGGAVYLAGLRHGYTLSGTIPASLAWGRTTRTPATLFRSTDEAYLGVRFFLSVLILTGTGLLLTIQSRWLGTIASLSSRRPSPGSTSSSGSHPALPAALVGSSSGANPVANTTPTNAPEATASAASSSSSSPTVPAWSAPAPVWPTPGPTTPTFTRSGQEATSAAASSPVVASSHFGYPHVPAPAAAPSPLPNGVSNPGVPASARPLILIIEDELAVADAVARILLSKGYGVMIAGDGEEGLRQARSARPDLIVLDLLLPSMLGMEVCRGLRSGDPTRQIPVIMATCVDGEADELAGLTAGADDYVAKPYSIEVLVARIQKLLQRRPAV